MCQAGVGATAPGVPVTVELRDIEGAPSLEIQLMQRSKLATVLLDEESIMSFGSLREFVDCEKMTYLGNESISLILSCPSETEAVSPQP